MIVVVLASLVALAAAAPCVDVYKRGATPPAASISRFPYYIDFEDFQRINAEDWYSESVNGESGVGCSSWTALLSQAAWVRGQPLACHSGRACWATGNNSVGYSSDENSVFGVATPFDLSSFTGPVHVSFWLSIDTLNGRDGLFLEVSRDAGASWQSAAGFAYDGSALFGSRSEPAFSGSGKNWRLVSGAVTGLEGAAAVLFRFRFKATASSGTRGGVVIDDVVISKSPLPACPVVNAPANGQLLNPVPLAIEWSPSGAAYYDLELRQPNVTVVGVGAGTKWFSPPLPVGSYQYSIRPREPDNTTNPWCQLRSFTIAFVNYEREFPFEASFENGNEKGFRNVDYDSGRIVVGAVPTDKQFAPAPSPSVAFTAGALSAVSWYVYETPFFNFTLLPAAILSFDFTHRLPTGAGALVQFSLNRGQSWHSFGAVGTGSNWYNEAPLSAFNFFLGPGSFAGFSGLLSTWKRASYSINDGSMPRDSWYSCSSEVIFRFVVAIGSNANGGTGFAFDNFAIGPDTSNPSAQCAAVVPPYSPPAPLTPVPTPVAPPTNAPTPLSTSAPPPTTAAPETTELPTTTTTVRQSSVVSTLTSASTTRLGPTTSGAPTTTAPTTAPETLAPDTTPPRSLPTFPPLTGLPPTEDGASSAVATTTALALTTTSAAPGTEFPGWAIAVIVVGLCCFLLFFLLLAALLRNRYNKTQQEQAAKDLDEAELRRGAAKAPQSA